MTIASTQSFTPQPLPREQLTGLSGRETLEKVLSGEFPSPPFAPTMLIDLIEVGEGRVAFRGQPDFSFLNPMGTVHGGWIATILDSAMGCAVHSTLKPGQLYTTTAMTINYVRPLMADSGEVRCEATTVYSGARMATSEGRLIDGKGRIIAHGSESCLIFETK
jgi:uncharacterized protein (TIGR00369 family)